MERKLIALISLILMALSVCGVAYSHWSETLHIRGTVTTGKWKACIRIQKTLDGAYTNPETGTDLTQPNRTHIAITANFATKFKLTIYIQNCESTTLTNVIVTDRIELNLAPRKRTATQGTVSWVNYAPGKKPWDGIHQGFNELTWNIGTLDPEESAYLDIWVETLQNPQDKYEPTSGDEGDGQDLEINKGATVVAESPHKSLSATTQGITILIGDDETPENGIGKILTLLPYTTWAEDKYP